MRGLRMAVGLRRFLATLNVVAFAVMLGGRPMTLRRVLVVFRRLAVSVLGHLRFPWFELRCALNASRPASFPTSPTRFGKSRRPASTALPLWNMPNTQEFSRGSNQREENTMVGWAIAFLVIALIAAVFGFGALAGAAFAAAKIIFVVALFALLVSAVLGLSHRGVP
jgi:uncharacterized membrane protein YtjA (UPF0391 family)